MKSPIRKKYIKLFKNHFFFVSIISNPFEFIRNKVRQHNVNVLAKKCNQVLPTVLQDPLVATLVLRVAKRHINMSAIVIQWNDAGFNDVPGSPNNRNGIPGQDKNAVINYLVTNGATNYHDMVFLFRDGPALADCENNLPRWTRRQAGVPDISVVACRINFLTGGLRASRIEIEMIDQAFNRIYITS